MTIYTWSFGSGISIHTHVLTRGTRGPFLALSKFARNQINPQMGGENRAPCGIQSLGFGQNLLPRTQGVLVCKLDQGGVHKRSFLIHPTKGASPQRDVPKHYTASAFCVKLGPALTVEKNHCVPKPQNRTRSTGIPTRGGNRQRQHSPKETWARA